KGAAWVFARSGSNWTQQGSKLTASNEIGAGGFGNSVALSSDGNTILVGGQLDNGYVGAVWVGDVGPPAAFDLVGPVNGAENLAPRPGFSWDQTTDAGSGVDHYELWIDGTKDQDVPVSACSGGVCSAQAQATLGQGPHSWVVKAVDGVGNVQASN